MAKKLTFEFVKEQIDNIQDYKLLSTKYVRANDKLLVKHLKCGHEYWVTYAKIVTCGHRCPVCAGNQRNSINHAKKLIESVDGYKLLSTEYVNNLLPLSIRCDKGHIINMSLGNFSQGKRCLSCENSNRSFDFSVIKNNIESVDGYHLLSNEYINNYTKLLIKHSCGNEFWMTYSGFNYYEHRCPVCAAKITSSKAEIEIQEFVKQKHPTMIENDRTQIINPLTGRYLELDIWLPELMKAIEYNGMYWHSKWDTKQRDKIKREQCKKLGINLLIIYEEDYTMNKDKELNKINNFINSNWSGK